MADTPGYPDTNATMFIDPRQRLVAAVADDPRQRVADGADEVQDRLRLRAATGAPQWDISEVLHVTPGRGVRDDASTRGSIG